MVIGYNVETLSELVAKGAQQMLLKLKEKQEEGRSGWDDQTNYRGMWQQLELHASRRDWIDVANFALFLWNLEKQNKD